MGIFVKAAKKIESLFKSKSDAAIMRAQIDVLQKNNEMLARWRLAQQESVGQSISPTTRSETLDKARYEYLNNPYGVGFASTFALYTIGNGPTLRMRAKSRNGGKSAFNPFVQNLFWNWGRKAHLSTTLQTGMRSWVVDGEALFRISANPKRDIAPFNFCCIDPQRIGNPGGVDSTQYMQDGVFFDIYGNVEKYCVYRHPTYSSQFFDSGDYEFVPANQIMHLMSPLLPEQVRGISWYLQSLNGMGRVRDYCLAVLQNMEICANYAVIFETDLGFGDDDDDVNCLPGNPEPWPTMQGVPSPRGKMTFAPPQSTAKQLKPEQPGTSYPEYKKTHIEEFGRSMDMPYNRSSGTSERYNYASGRLDGQAFELKVSTLQGCFEEYVLNPFFEIWYTLALPYFFENYEGPHNDVLTAREIVDCRQRGLGLDEKNIDLYQWKWAKPTHVDPLKVAQANDLNLKNGIETRENIIEENNGDADDYADQIKKEATMFPPFPGIKPVVENDEIDEDPEE